MVNLFNPLADYLKPSNTTVPFAPGVTPTYSTPAVQKQKSNWLEKYTNDPSISEEGKKNLLADIENGVLDEDSADNVIKEVYREKEPGFLEGFAEKTGEAFGSAVDEINKTGDKFASGEIGFGSAAMRGASGALGAAISPITGAIGQGFEEATDVETREGLKQSLAPKVGQYMEWFNAQPKDQQERLRDIGAGADVVATAFGLKTGAEALKQTAKATKQAGQSIVWGVKNVAQKVPGMGEPNIAKKIGQETAEAVFDNKKVLINKPERGIGEIITKPVREKNTKVLAGRAVSPRWAGMTDKQKVKLVENTEKNVRELHKLNRTGVLKGDIDTLEDTAQTLVSNLDEVGEQIGKAVSQLKGWPGGSQNYFKPETSQAIRSALSSKIEGKAVANTALRDFNKLTANVKTYKDAFALKKIYQAELKKLARSGDASSDSFRALAQGVQDLDDALENAVTNQLKGTQFDKAKSQYALMKRLIGDIAQSAMVEGRRSPNTFVEQLSYLDALTSPISTAKQALVKEISDLNTRGWAWKELVKLLDEEAIGRAKLIPTKPTPKPSSLPTGKIDAGKPLIKKAKKK